jgi:RND family efflux transporter MFP subunit
MATDVDLQGLAVRREAPASVAPRAPRRWLARYLLPGSVVVGFLAVMAWAARDRLLPRQKVTVAPVIVQRASAQRAGTPLFQAAGWIEPRPTATVVTALADGVVDKLLVVEGQEVQQGEPVAELIDADARLAVREAEARLEIQQGEVEKAQADVTAARTRVDYPVHLEAAVAEAQAELSKAERELEDHHFDVRAWEAKVELARLTLKGREEASGVVSGRAIQQAKADLAAAEAELDQHKARLPKLEKEVKSLAAKRDAAERLLELKTDEVRMLAEAQALARSNEAKLREAQVALDTAQLRLERMTVRAPAKGRVLALVAHPGTRVMGLAQATFSEASTVVTMYDPERLQVRADVLLEDVPRVQPGQPVRIETAAAGKPLVGEVLFATSQADIQKNTLQVKVAIKSPPAVIKPEMLVRVTFLAPASDAPAQSAQSVRLFVPKSLVTTGPEGAFVWLADRTAGVARRRSVKLGTDADGELVEVTTGLTVADKLIAGGREGLSDAARIEVTGEETSLGLAAVPQGAARSDLKRLMPSGEK